MNELICKLIAVVIICISTLVSVCIMYDKKNTAISNAIEIAVQKGIDPVAVRCAFAAESDNICIVYTQRK
jgi:hypothetical protein